MATIKRVSFEGGRGADLAARLEMPPGPVRACALFAHCFTCSKDIFAARRIAAGLAEKGIAVLRFDFTGLGNSGGDFASTDFSSNVADLIRAADYLRETFRAPDIVIGHSLGGAAVLAAAGEIAEVRAVATIGAPADADHVIENFAAHVDDIERDGTAEVTLGGRQFTIRREFLQDLRAQAVTDRVAAMKKPLMVMHAPFDDVVGIDNASRIFMAAKHPKSFVSLDSADHLLSKREDADYAAEIIAAWASRYIPDTEVSQPDSGVVRVEETGGGTYQNRVAVGSHGFLADEPTSVGGLDSGPTPYDLLGAALGTCTSMTLRMYANRKKLAVNRISVDISHDKIHAADCEECSDDTRAGGGRIDRFERLISIDADIDDATRARMLEIADLCPVHKTLEAGAVVVTRDADIKVADS